MSKMGLILFGIVITFFLAGGALAQQAADKTINGLIYLINTDAEAEMDGLLKWEKELKARSLTAMIKASNPVLDTYPEIFRRLAAQGHEIIGGYPGICWDMPYKEQYAAMKSVKARMERLTDRRMTVFACSYSSYDENTIRAAQALGVPYVLARGTEDVRALIYRPKEYNVGILEVSNVEFGKMGKGSLCDISLFSRGATETEFAKVFSESVAKDPDSMILVSHPHIGGTKTGYWKVYEGALASRALVWRTFDDWISQVSVVSKPYAEIPENREVEYLEPKPAIPLEQLKNLPEVGRKIVIFHNGQGPMCKDAKEFLATLDYPVEEHLEDEKNFLKLLDRYMMKLPKSKGASRSYEYFPIIFVNGQAFSGFDKNVGKAILKAIQQP